MKKLKVKAESTAIRNKFIYLMKISFQDVEYFDDDVFIIPIEYDFNIEQIKLFAKDNNINLLIGDLEIEASYYNL